MLCFLSCHRRITQRTLATSFAAWSEHTVDMQHAKQAMQQVAARLANRQLAAAFYAWQDTVQHQRHARHVAHKIMLRFQQASKVPKAISCFVGQFCLSACLPVSLHKQTISHVPVSAQVLLSQEHKAYSPSSLDINVQKSLPLCSDLCQ